MPDERITPRTPAGGIKSIPPTVSPPAPDQQAAGRNGASPRWLAIWLATVTASVLAFVLAYRSWDLRGTPSRGPQPRSAAAAPDQHPADGSGTSVLSPLPPDAVFVLASPAVVRVVIQDRQRRTVGSGSGFLVSTKGLIATNYHVVEKAHAAHVVLADGAEVPVMGAAALDQEADVAIIKAAGEIGARPLELAEGGLPPVGAKVYAIGSPLGSFVNTLSDGLVSGHRETGTIPYFLRMPTMIQTTAPISHGSSGGPLLNADGKVVGVMTLTFAADGENLNFAVPASHLARLLPRCEGQLRRLPLVREPDPDALAYIKRGDALMGKNRYDEALEDYDAAVRIDPEYAVAYHKRGMAWYCKGKFDKAFEDMDEASRLDPRRFPK